MKFKKEDLLSITEDEYPVGFTAVEEGDWVCDGKYERQEIIFKFNDKFYALWQTRTGSYYTDWYYDSDDWDDEEDVGEVEPVEVKTIQWKRVK